MRRITLMRCAPICFLAVAACASTPPPVGDMAAARSAVAQAQPLAARHAPDELLAARTKLGLAEAAFAQEDYETARRLAEKARADARLATALADEQRMREAVAEVNQGIEVLKQQLERRGQ